MTDMKEIWSTLSAIDCTKHIEKKGNLSYLSWAWAWAILMDHYPDSKHTVIKEESFADGSVETWCEIEIEGHTRQMWLPVMDHRNNAVVNPSARQISDTRMRCMVKCLARFGLGHYIYAGEDVPKPPPVSQSEFDELKSAVDMALSADSSEQEKVRATMRVAQIMAEAGEDKATELFNAAEKGDKTAFKKKVRELERAASDKIDECVEYLNQCAESDDPEALEFAASLSSFEKHRVWDRLPLMTKEKIKAMKLELAA